MLQWDPGTPGAEGSELELGFSILLTGDVGQVT